ncbi:MAG: site-specific DNA-methyltransferase [Armatimonadetes bacterium]|nr:site-specific DNA-methyltransferase [Armatimonadota bacterium]
MNTLFYGDNLQVLREQVPDESVDLVYLDPPFNSARNYNVLFRQVKGDPSPAQIMAFEDTWTWSPRLYDEFISDPRNVKLFDLMDSLKKILGQSEMMAYMLMMAPRLLELHRKLKPTGSLYLHCDPVASHYLKLTLDVVFGPQNFRNEIIWKRTSAHSDARNQFADISDSILFFIKSPEAKFKVQYGSYSEEYIQKYYRYVDENGRRYMLDNLRSPNPRPNLTYEYKGYKPHPNGWAVSRERMEQLDAEGRIWFPKDIEKKLRIKRFLDDMPGIPLGNVWTDISPINSQAKERRGYPTQKPLALLERIIAASSNEGDVVMDPFCGCGTAVVAAERMKRRWIGIDVTYLAIAEVVYRLHTETEAKRDATYRVVGSPEDDYSARKFFEETAPQNHKPFEMWAVSLVEGEPQEKKGADRGVDGRIPIYDVQGKLHWALIQVKGGNLKADDIRAFGQVIDREKALFGLLITLNPPSKRMATDAEEMGFVEGFGTRKIPKLQIMTIKELLEEKKRFDLPEGYIPQRHQGVGKLKPQQAALWEE